ncbi:MAG: hypothetical protein Q8L98_00135 [Chlamydiales bacterium]|nr:hypothetical protein [Chlamydiales bacterium]
MSAIHSLRSSQVQQILQDKQASICQKEQALVAIANNPKDFEGVNPRIVKVAALLLSAQATLSSGTNPSKKALEALSVYVRSINSIEAYQQTILDQQKAQNRELLQHVESLNSEKEQSFSTLSELNNTILELERGMGELQQALGKLESEKTQERVVSEEHIALLNRYLSSAQKECVQLRKERDETAKNLIETFEAQKQLLTQTLLKEHTDKVEELKQGHQQEIVKLKQENEQLADETRRLRKANQGLKTKNANLRNQIEELQNVAYKLLSFILSIKDYLTSFFDSLSLTFSQLMDDPAIQKYQASDSYQSKTNNLPALSEADIAKLEAYTALKGELEGLKTRAETLVQSFEDLQKSCPLTISLETSIKSLKSDISILELTLVSMGLLMGSNSLNSSLKKDDIKLELQQLEQKISQLEEELKAQTEAEQAEEDVPTNQIWSSSIWW